MFSATTFLLAVLAPLGIAITAYVVWPLLRIPTAPRDPDSAAEGGPSAPDRSGELSGDAGRTDLGRHLNREIVIERRAQLDRDLAQLPPDSPERDRLILEFSTAALDDLARLAAEALEKLDADISQEDLEDSDPFEEGDLGVLADVGLPDAVLSVILSETDLYADEQLGRIAREMGFAEELSAVLDRLDR